MPNQNPSRIIAVGDIHGCAVALERLLETIGPQPGDLWVPLGDYVDRGPDSRRALDLLVHLSASCDVRPLKGNHEEMLLAVLEGTTPPHDWLQFGGVSTLDSYHFTGDLSVIPQVHREFLYRCVDYVELDQYFFVHANYHPRKPLNRLDAYTLRWKSLLEGIPGPHTSGRTAIVGHTPDRSGEILDLGYLKCLDTYCYGGMWLTAMDLLSGSVWQANQLGELRQ